MKKSKPKKKTAKKKSPKKSSARKSVVKPKSQKKKVKEKSPQKPETKSSFKPHPDKLAIVRQTFVTVLWRHEELTRDQVREIVQNEIAHQFPTEFTDYFNHVNELLTKFRLIEQVPGKSPLHIRLTQRFED